MWISSFSPFFDSFSRSTWIIPCLVNAIDNLRAGGSTNGGQGIALAYDVAEKSFIPGGLNRFNPKSVGAYRLIGYEDRLLQAHEFNDDKKDAGDMGAGHTVIALYEIISPGQRIPGAKIDALKYQQPPKPSEAADSSEWLTLKLRYKDPDAETSKLLSQPLIGAPWKFTQVPEDFRFASAVAAFGMLLRNSEHRGNATYAQVRKLAAGAMSEDRNGHRAEFLTMIDAAERLAPQK